MTGRIETETSRQRHTLLHVTACPDGGVTRAIELAIKATPEIEHVVLAPEGAVRTDDLGVRHLPLAEGMSERIRGIRRAVTEVRASAVHAHSSWAGVYTRLAKVDVPLLYQPHCYAFADVTKPTVVRAAFWLAERFMTSRTSAVLALTPHEERQARRLGIHVVHRITNAPTVSRLGLASGDTDHGGVTAVAMVGRITPAKDPEFFARVAESFVDDSSVRFVWIGSSADSPAGLAALKRAGVEVTGWLTGDRLVERLAAANVYLHTSVYEGFPLSLLDACELGVPSLVRDIPQLAGCGLPIFRTVPEAVSRIRELIAQPRVQAAVAQASSALSTRQSIDAHDASIAHAYAHHGLGTA